MKFRLITVVCLSSFFLLGINQDVYAQSRQELEERRLKIIQRIENADNALSKVRSTKKSSLKDFRLIEQKIQDRERLISNIQNDLVLSEKDLQGKKNETSVLQTDLGKLKKRYYELLNAAYKQQHSFNKWAFIFNSNSINDSFQKWKYIKQYEAFCREEYQNLQTADLQLKASISDLNNAITDRQKLLDEQSSQFELIKQELAQKDLMIEKLRDQESELKGELAQQKGQREQLNSAIENSIIAALKGNETTVNTIPSAEETNVVSVAFGNKKKRLSWPVDGYVVSNFGRQKHPTLQNVFISNNGIDIETSAESAANAVSGGTVVGISEIPGFGKTVIVKHGEYYTVYSKLKSINVSAEETINEGTRIGEIDVDEAGQRVMHFEIWKGKKKLDPLKWLKNN